MKTVSLIKIDSGEALIQNMQDCLQASHCPPLDSSRFIKNSDMEYVQHSRIEVENIPIQRIVDHGHEHYVAVTVKVWEYLYLIENPVTAKSQEAKIKKLSKDVDFWYREADKMGTYLNDLKKNIHTASLWRRIKWVFKGFDYYD